jgi:hypothetical protein
VDLKTAIGKNWKDSSTLMLYTLVGGLLPVYGGMILFKLFSRGVHFSDFSDNGEFALYSAAMIAPSLYLILKDYGSSNFLYRRAFALISFLGLLCATILFAGVTAVRTGGLGAIAVDQQFLRWFTILLFMVAIFLSFLTSALDSERIAKDIYAVREQDFKNLEEQFERLEEKDR